MLYVIEYLCQIKLEEIYQAFSERTEIFEQLRDYFGSRNKKIAEIANSILNIFNPGQKKVIESEPNKEKLNLFVRLNI